MNQDILNQLDPTLESTDKKVKIEDLAEYAKVACRKCYGRGYSKKVRNVGNKQWVFDHYDICSCVLKNKKLPELWAKIQKESKKDEIETPIDAVIEPLDTVEVMSEEINTPEN